MSTPTPVSDDHKFRDYSSADEQVKHNYKQARTFQTYEYVAEHLHHIYLQFDNQMTIAEGLKLLDNFIDLSDPDLLLPNIVHAYQVAEKIRADGRPDWFQLVGLLHDLGKVMYIKGCDEDGTSIKQQWSLVGDTFIVGHIIPDTIVYPEFNQLNSDHKLYQNQPYGIYRLGIGLDQCMISFGHDEYLYQVFKYNQCLIPEIGLKMIRYHSMYVWHTYGAYRHLMNDQDHQTLKWVQLFNQYDLYTKSNSGFALTDEIKEYYNQLIDKYFPDKIISF